MLQYGVYTSSSSVVGAYEFFFDTLLSTKIYRSKSGLIQSNQSNDEKESAADRLDNLANALKRPTSDDCLLQLDPSGAEWLPKTASEDHGSYPIETIPLLIPPLRDQAAPTWTSRSLPLRCDRRPLLPIRPTRR